MVGILVLSVTTLLWIYIVGNDPTVRTLRRRIRLNAQWTETSEEDFPKDLTAVLPPSTKRVRRSRRRRD